MGILLAILAVIGVLAALAYLAAMAIVWMAGIMFVGLAVLFAVITGDPYMGSICAFVVMIVGGLLLEKFGKA